MRDEIAAEHQHAFLDNLARHGRLVVGGGTQNLEGWPEIVTGRASSTNFITKAASVRGFMNRLMTDRWAEARARVFALHDEGRLAVTFDEPCFARPEGMCGAIERLLSGQTMGKVVVDLTPQPTGDDR